VAVRARVKGWHFPSVGELGIGGGRKIPQGFLPTVDDPQSFTLEVTDRDGARGEDYFAFEVHTPETIQDELERRGALFGRGLVVVVDEYDPDRVAEAMRPLVESVEADAWEELAFRVGFLGPWEFEGWKWHPDAEELRPHRGVEAEVRDVRILRTSVSDAFSLPAEIRFGGSGVDQELTVPMVLESPLWIRGRSSPGDVVLGAGRVFALKPDADVILSALAGTERLAQAPSWEMLRLALEPLQTPGT
jgi:hypothetical protein